MPPERPPERPRSRTLFTNSNEPTAKYAKLTEAQRLAYHTHVYAFRIVYLGKSERDQTWDGDPKGEYFNADLIAAEATRLQQQKDRQDGSDQRARDHHNDPRNDPIIQAQRRAFAKLKGYPNWPTCLEAMWQDAQAHAHPDTGQPDAMGAWRRSGFAGFCAEWRDRLVRDKRAQQHAVSQAAE
jgi:hypothetical protein